MSSSDVTLVRYAERDISQPPWEWAHLAEQVIDSYAGRCAALRADMQRMTEERDEERGRARALIDECSMWETRAAADKADLASARQRIGELEAEREAIKRVIKWSRGGYRSMSGSLDDASHTMWCPSLPPYELEGVQPPEFDDYMRALSTTTDDQETTNNADCQRHPAHATRRCPEALQGQL